MSINNITRRHTISVTSTGKPTGLSSDGLSLASAKTSADVADLLGGASKQLQDTDDRIGTRERAYSSSDIGQNTLADSPKSIAAISVTPISSDSLPSVSTHSTPAIRENRTIQNDAAQVRDKQLQIYQNALQTLLEKTSEPEKKTHIELELKKVGEDRTTVITLGDTSSTKAAEKSLKHALGSKSDPAGTQSRMEALLAKLDNGTDATRSSVSKGIKKFLSLPGIKHLLGWNIGLLGQGIAKAIGDPIKHEAKVALQNAREAYLNTESTWEKKVGVISPGITSTITPANQNASETLQNTVMENRKQTGITCQSNTKENMQAANNQMTTLTRATSDTNKEKTIFSGVRHAIVATKKPNLDALTLRIGNSDRPISSLTGPEMATYLNQTSGIVSDKAREKITKLVTQGSKSDIKEAQKKLGKQLANHNKAVDLLRSTLHQKLEIAIKEGKPLSSPIQVDLTSVSLITPDDIRTGFGLAYHEKHMIAEQRDALHLLSQMSPEEKNSLLSEFQHTDGSALFGNTLPTLEISVATFNFGVNELELAGRANQREMNAAAMETLMTRVNDRLASLQDGPEKDLLQRMNTKVSDMFTMYESLGAFSGKQAMPYEMPVLIAALSDMCDGSLLFNCKSGKDRTGMFDVQVKIFINNLYQAIESGGNIDDALNYFSRLDEAFSARESGTIRPEQDSWLSAQQDFNRDVMKNSGNREVQEENTTGWGYKLEGENTARMFEVMFGVKNLSEVYGFSKMFGA